MGTPAKQRRGRREARHDTSSEFDVSYQVGALMQMVELLGERLAHLQGMMVGGGKENTGGNSPLEDRVMALEKRVWTLEKQSRSDAIRFKMGLNDFRIQVLQSLAKLPAVGEPSSFLITQYQELQKTMRETSAGHGEVRNALFDMERQLSDVREAASEAIATATAASAAVKGSTLPPYSMTHAIMETSEALRPTLKFETAPERAKRLLEHENSRLKKELHHRTSKPRRSYSVPTRVHRVVDQVVSDRPAPKSIVGRKLPLPDELELASKVASSIAAGSCPGPTAPGPPPPPHRPAPETAAPPPESTRSMVTIVEASPPLREPSFSTAPRITPESTPQIQQRRLSSSPRHSRPRGPSVVTTTTASSVDFAPEPSPAVSHQRAKRQSFMVPEDRRLSVASSTSSSSSSSSLSIHTSEGATSANRPRRSSFITPGFKMAEPDSPESSESSLKFHNESFAV